MTLGPLSIGGIAFLLMCVFFIAFLGYGLGRISIKGVSLGTAGVFIVALLFGCFFSLQHHFRLIPSAVGKICMRVNILYHDYTAFPAWSILSSVPRFFCIHHIYPPQSRICTMVDAGVARPI